MSDTNDQPAESGLLDNVTVEDENTQAQDSPQKSEITHQAADTTEPGKIPGAPVDRPEWLPENFWNAEDGEANYEGMAKSWADMRKMVSQGAHKAPPDGKYDTSVFKTENLEEDPLASAYLGWAQKYGVSQAAFNEMASQFQDIAQQMAPPPMDAAAEMKKLGPNAQAVINSMADWGRGFVNKGVWSEEDFEEYKIMGGTAKGLNALQKMRSAYEGRIPTQSIPVDGAPSKDELYEMVADPRYQTDKAYRSKVEKAFSQFAG